MQYLALDIGSSFVKGAILDPRHERIEQVRRVPCPEPVTGLPPLHFELDPLQVVAAVARLLDEFAPSAGHCAGILVCGQMGGVVLCGPGGQPRGNYLSWRDQRATQPAPSLAGKSLLDELPGRLTDQAWHELGNELRAGSTSTLLAWLVANGHTPGRDTRPCSLAGFVSAHLGETDCRMHATEAIGLIDVGRGEWHRDALRTLIGADLSWPELAEWRQPVAWWKLGGQRLPCFVALGDHQCALAGSGLAPGELSINISTGSQVSRLTRPGELARPASGVPAAQTRAYFDDWLLRTVTHLPAGRSLEALVDVLTELPRLAGLADFDPWAAVAAAARSAADSELEVDLTLFAGPLGDRGAIRQLSLDNLHVGNLFRAAWRGMASNYRKCAGWLSPAEDWTRLVYSGGLAHKLDLLRRFTSEQFGCPERVCVATEDTLQGLLALAMVLNGQADGVIEAGRRLNVQSNPIATREGSN